MISKFMKSFIFKIFVCFLSIIFSVNIFCFAELVQQTSHDASSAKCNDSRINASEKVVQHTPHGSFNAKYIDSKLEVSTVSSEYKAWMTDLPDNALIKNLNIPGTHDAGTYNVKMGTDVGLIASYAECQGLTITGQLEIGIRIFDVRIRDDGVINHGGFDCLRTKSSSKLGNDVLKFEHVVTEIKEFLDKNPKEAVFIKTKQEDNKEPIAPVVNKALNECGGGKVYIPSKKFNELTLGDIRGKIVVLAGVDGVDNSYRLEWGKGAFTIGDFSLDAPNAPAQGKYQDKYKKTNPEDKVKTIQNFFSSLKDDNNSLFLNFASFFEIDAANLFGGLKGVSNKTWNSGLKAMFTQSAYKKKRLGIIFFDYPEDGSKENILIYGNKLRKDSLVIV